MGKGCGSCISSGANAQAVDSLDFIKLLIADADPIQQIDPLIHFIENQLTRMKDPTEASSSSGGIQVEAVVASSTTLAAQIIDKISTEAQTFADSEIAKAIGSTAISAAKVIGETHWIFLALAMAAYALERCGTVTSNVEECRELLVTVAEVAKDLKKFKEAMGGESDQKVGKAVKVVAEGAFMCCQYIAQGRASRYWSATTIEKELHKTREQIREIWPSLIFTAVTQIARNLTLRSHLSPFNFLDFKPVGIEKQISEVEKLLDMSGSDPAVAVILQGFGGVGKTTLAAAVIQNLDLVSTDFKFCRVIIDEKTPDKRSHILDLQRNIIQDFEGRKYDLRDADDGRGQIQRAMENKCCFLFVDNVVDSDYIRQLLPKHLLPASENSKMRILITSRGSDLRAVLGIKNRKEYDVNTLSPKASKTLLRSIILEDVNEAHHLFNNEARLIDEVAEASLYFCLSLEINSNLKGRRSVTGQPLQRWKRETSIDLQMMMNTWPKSFCLFIVKWMRRIRRLS